MGRSTEDSSKIFSLTIGCIKVSPWVLILLLQSIPTASKLIWLQLSHMIIGWCRWYDYHCFWVLGFLIQLENYFLVFIANQEMININVVIFTCQKCAGRGWYFWVSVSPSLVCCKSTINSMMPWNHILNSNAVIENVNDISTINFLMPACLIKFAHM